MPTVLRSRSTSARAALAAALIAPLLAAGCAAVRPVETAAFAPAEGTRIFAAGYANINETYIRRVEPNELAAAGLSNLTKLDPDLIILQTGRHVDIAVAGTLAGGFDWPQSGSARDWAVATSGAINLARTASPELADYDADTLYKMVFDGMLGKLDPFSRYFPPESAREHRAAREGFGGIGVRFVIEGDGLRVSSVMKDGPGARAGLRPDDLITHVDGKAVTGIDLEAVHQRLRGSIGSQIALTLARPSGAQTMTLTRALIVPDTVASERLGSVAYFRLYRFNQETTRTLSAAIKRAKDEMGTELAGIVLDLRDNPGGLLDQAVGVADLFMQSGRIIATRGRHRDTNQRFEATKGDIADGLPIVVLVNGNSASASEIVAVALQDSGRAVVAGTASYGKGVIQTVVRMPNQGELTLTSAQVLAPSGYSIHHLGVLPSVCIVGDSAAEPILAALKSRKIAPMPIALRNSVWSEDMTVLDQLRSRCPARTTDNPTDVDVAVSLIQNSALYRQALNLAFCASCSSPNDVGRRFRHFGERPVARASRVRDA